MFHHSHYPFLVYRGRRNGALFTLPASNTQQPNQPRDYPPITHQTERMDGAVEMADFVGWQLNEIE